LIGVGIGSRRPRPPNRTGGFPAYGSPVGSFCIESGSRAGRRVKRDRPSVRGSCPDAVTSAATMPSGRSEASTHDQAHGVTMRGSVRPELAQGNAGAAVLRSAILHLPSCPAFPRGGFASRPSHGLMHQGRSGTTRALTPGRLAHAGQVSPLSCLAVRASHSQPRNAAPASLYQSPQRARPDLAAQTSPRMSRLVAAHRRIRFVILRAARSPPVALHPASRRRSYLRLHMS
jgi:hypothetical protein